MSLDRDDINSSSSVLEPFQYDSKDLTMPNEAKPDPLCGVPRKMAPATELEIA